MRLYLAALLSLFIVTNSFKCKRQRPATPPPPPVGTAAISIDAIGPDCCNNCPVVDKGHLWKIRNLRNDVYAYVTYVVEWNSSNTMIENWVFYEKKTVQLSPGYNDLVNGNYCSKRLQGNTLYTTGDYRVIKFSACTADQNGCKELTTDTVILKYECIESFNFNLFDANEKAAAIELYEVLTKPAFKNHKFRGSMTDFFDGCPEEVAVNNNDIFELTGTVCNSDFLLPFDVDVILTTGPDHFNSIYITSTNYTKGEIKRIGNNGTLTFSKMEGLPYSMSMYMEVSKTYKHDILRTIEARNGTLIFKGDFICFEIVDIPID